MNACLGLVHLEKTVAPPNPKATIENLNFVASVHCKLDSPLPPNELQERQGNQSICVGAAAPKRGNGFETLVSCRNPYAKLCGCLIGAAAVRLCLDKDRRRAAADGLIQCLVDGGLTVRLRFDKVVD